MPDPVGEKKNRERHVAERAFAGRVENRHDQARDQVDAVDSSETETTGWRLVISCISSSVP
jgi:hypothetical protein